MGEERLPEAVYRELLTDTRDALKTVRKLMNSGSEDVQVFAVDAFLKLSSLAAALAETLDETAEYERNPLSRRSREEGGGVL